jgi:A/G-specific adenine glycosylase
VARRRGRLLLGRRPARGLFGGLWELPAVEVPEAATLGEARSAVATLLGPGARVDEALGEVQRLLTHRRLRLSLFSVQAPARTRAGDYLELRWVTAVEAQHLGISSAMQAALDAAAKAAPSARPAPRTRRRGRTLL